MNNVATEKIVFSILMSAGVFLISCTGDDQRSSATSVSPVAIEAADESGKSNSSEPTSDGSEVTSEPSTGTEIAVDTRESPAAGGTVILPVSIAASRGLGFDDAVIAIQSEGELEIRHNITLESLVPGGIGVGEITVEVAPGSLEAPNGGVIRIGVDFLNSDVIADSRVVHLAFLADDERVWYGTTSESDLYRLRLLQLLEEGRISQQTYDEGVRGTTETQTGTVEKKDP